MLERFRTPKVSKKCPSTGATLLLGAITAKQTSVTGKQRFSSQHVHVTGSLTAHRIGPLRFNTSVGAGLNSLGKNLFQPTDASGAATVGTPGGTDGLGSLLQGYVEQSNVSVVDQFINLITSQRAYEANSKVVKAADDMYQQANNLPK